MPKRAKTLYKYKCMEVMCNTVHRKDKWIDHCKKKHPYKYKNNLDIKFQIIQVKKEGGRWEKLTELTPTSNQLQEEIKLTSVSITKEDDPIEMPKDPVPGPSSSFDGDSEIMSFEPEVTRILTSNLCDSERKSCEHKVTRILTSDLSDSKSMSCEPDVTRVSTSDLPSTTISGDSPLNPALQFHVETPLQENEISNSCRKNVLRAIEDVTDPANFANIKLSPEDIYLGLKLENQDFLSINFQVTGGRKCNPSLKNCTLPDGSVKQRSWLVYSRKVDALFCLHCILFALPTERTVWSTYGYRGWIDHRGLRDLELHENSKNHLSAQISRLQWLSKRRIDINVSEQSNQLVQHHREVFKVIIDCCRYLSEEMLAFRKKDNVQGKMANLFRMVAKYSPDARVYLEKLDTAKKVKAKLGSNFLSYRNIFDLITIMSEMVVSKIVQNINYCNCYSVILDSTQDVSKKECTAVLLRYVEHLDSDGIPRKDMKPQERLVKVFTSGDTTGVNLSSELLKHLKSLGLNTNQMVGQSLDGAGNMKGRYNGLKSFVLRECPKAFYVWCCSHRFALVVEKSMDSSPQMRAMFLLLQEIYVFLSGHRRHHIFIERLKNDVPENRRKRLKRVQTTRWSSKNDALQTVLSCYSTIIQTLEDIQTDKLSENETRAAATGLMKKLKEFETIVAMHIASVMFKILSPVTVCLQSIVIDYGIIPKIISETKQKLGKLRNGDEWERIALNVKKFAEDNDVELTFKQNRAKRKRFLDELCLDERVTEPIKKMKVEVFLTVVDSLCTQIEDRFPENSLNICQQMCHFTHEGILKIENYIEQGQISTRLKVQELCDYYSLDSELIMSELETFSRLYKEAHKGIDISDLNAEVDIKTSSHNLSESEDEDKQQIDHTWMKKGFIIPYRCITNFSGFPNLTVLLRILLSLAVTSCSAERTMSRLKIVKNRLRSSMGDAWLSNLLILASENDILKEISNEDILNKFALSSAQRKKILLFK